MAKLGPTTVYGSIDVTGVTSLNDVILNTLNGAVVATGGLFGTDGTPDTEMIPVIGTNGVMEVGRYIDFHISGGASDYDARFDASSSNVLDLKGSKLRVLEYGIEAYGNSPFLSLTSTSTAIDATINFVSDSTQNARIRHEITDGNLPNTSGQALFFEDTSSTSHPLHIVVGGNIYASGTQRVFADNYHPNADKWTTARTLTTTLTGDVTGSASMSVDGTGNKTTTITTVVANDSHTHDTRYARGDTLSPSGSYYQIRGKTNANTYICTPASGLLPYKSGTSGGSVLGTSSWRFSSAYINTVYGALSGNASTSSRWATARTLSLTGDASGSVSIDGSTNASINVVVADDSHLHTRIDPLNADWNAQTDEFRTGSASNVSGAPSNDFINWIQWGHNGGSKFRHSLWTDTSNIDKLHYAYKNNTSNTTSDATSQRIFMDNYHPNADKWTTARTLSLTGDATGSVSWDGSANASITVDVNEATHAALADRVDITTTFSGKYPMTVDVNGLMYSHTGVQFEGSSGTVFATKFSGALTGNATTASKWATARTISLAGDASGSVSIDGSANKTLTVAVANDSHTHDGRYYTEAEANARFAPINGAGYLPLTGGSLTGSMTIDAGTSSTLNVICDDAGVANIQAMGGSQGTGRIYVGQSSTHGGGLEYNGDGTPTGSGSGSDYITLFNRAGSDDNWTARNKYNSNNWEFRGSVTAASFIGNASSASKLATARTISLAGDASGSVSFDGSANASITVAVANDSHTHDGRYYTEAEADARFAPINGAGYLSLTGGTITGSMTVNGTLSVRTAIDLADNDILRFGSSDDVEFFCNGSHMYTDLNSDIGNWYVRDGSTTRFTFDDAGHFTATGNVTAYSDIRLKSNIERIENPLEKIKQLSGYTYDKKRSMSESETRRETGVIAQEVEKVLPEAVHVDANDPDSIKSVAYGNMIGLLVESIKELNEKVERLETPWYKKIYSKLFN
ncbi:long tail fiber protein distal subunit [Vibrio phage F86]